ncbi:MAG: DUF3592 domain-containing protein [Chloroflexi bacterium]|nr:DUF3592 domain-containing protein [Chloroflexota bacterium]
MPNFGTSEVVYIVVCIAGSVLFALFITAATVLPMVGIFGGLGWFFSKRSKEAKALNAAAQAWLSTTGTVLKSRVEVTGGDHASVTPVVVYQYQVEGQSYQAEQIRAGDMYLAVRKRRTAYDLVDKYPVGAQVTVYYDPANPGMAALER